MPIVYKIFECQYLSWFSEFFMRLKQCLIPTLVDFALCVQNNRNSEPELKNKVSHTNTCRFCTVFNIRNSVNTFFWHTAYMQTKIQNENLLIRSPDFKFENVFNLKTHNSSNKIVYTRSTLGQTVLTPYCSEIQSLILLL